VSPPNIAHHCAAMRKGDIKMRNLHCSVVKSVAGKLETVTSHP
jgi:hypothetical protein